MNLDIILIGPIGAGKSTVAELLASRLNLPQCSMDELRYNYYKEIGYDEELVKQKRKIGIWELQKYWKPFEIHAVERLLSEYSQCVIDFGAGHSVYEDAIHFQRVQKALTPYPNVFLLLPSPNLDESVQILDERNQFEVSELRSLNEHFVRHASNYKLAKFIVYTKDKTAEETCEEIILSTCRKS
jgi:shikimate kinase